MNEKRERDNEKTLKHEVGKIQVPLFKPMLSNSVKKRELREARLLKTKKAYAFQSSWIVLMTFFSLTREILEKKRVTISIELFFNLTGFYCCKHFATN